MKSVLERFEEKYAPCPMSGCWLWTAAYFRGGYGSFDMDGRTRRANRVSWELYRGLIPAGLSVLHRCDVKQCVNPDHLFLGTHADNMADMAQKGRAASGNKNGTYTKPGMRSRGSQNGAHTKPERRCRGETHGSAKLTDEAVREILSSLASGASLARRFGVGRNAIYEVRHGRRWTHVQ